MAHVHGLLPHAHHLVAEHERIFHARLRPEVAEHHGAFDLLDGIDPVAFGAQAGDALLRRLVISPRHGQFGTERRLVDVAVGRRRGDAAEGDAFHGESIPRAEESPYVLQRTDVVEHHRDGHFLHRGELPGRGPVQLFVGDFTHNVCK